MNMSSITDNLNHLLLNDVILPTMLLEKTVDLNGVDYLLLSNDVANSPRRLFILFPSGFFNEKIVVCPFKLKDKSFKHLNNQFMCLALCVQVTKNVTKNSATFYFLGLKRIYKDDSNSDCKLMFEKLPKDLIENGDYLKFSSDLRSKFFDFINKAGISFDFLAFANIFTTFDWLPDLVVSLLSTSFEFKYDHLNCNDFVKRIDRAQSALSSFNFETGVPLVRTKLKNLNDCLDKIFLKFFNVSTPNSKQTSIVPMKILNEMKLFKLPKKDSDDLSVLQSQIKSLKAPKSVLENICKQFDYLSQIDTFSIDYHINKVYLDYVVNLPWSKSTSDLFDLQRLREQLDKEHFGLENVKKRIIEYFVVQSIKKSSKGPILCFVGPAGVGKTSIAYSIAKSLGRKFYKISLGGVNDSSFLKGHRKTYVGAMSGQILNALKTTGVNNPVILLDEIDKMCTGYSKDPTAALLEVLDHQQNESFLDHYVNISFDLSNVLFIATANSQNKLSSFILDRVELISMKNYSIEEKFQIAKKYLIVKRLDDCGISDENIEFTDDALNEIIVYYTYESGVRDLSRKIDSICRYIAVKLYEKSHNIQVDSIVDQPTENIDVQMSKGKIIVDIDFVTKVFGSRIYNFNKLAMINQPGIVIGLACNDITGNTLVIEATKSFGKGELKLTGNLGNTIQESANLAFSWLKSNCHLFDIDYKSKISEIDVHIHFPSGSIKKDGPSAGLAITLAIVSLFIDEVVEPSLAMSGEMTLRGLILPVGGIRDKVTAAFRAGIRTVILPTKNKDHVDKISSDVKNSITFHYVSSIEQALNIAFDNRIISKFPKLITLSEKCKL